MKNYFFKLFVRWFLAKNREVHKITSEDEIKLFKFTKPEDVVKVLKSIMTSQTLLHWEAKDEESRNLIRGSAMMLKIILRAHEEAVKIEEDDKKKLEKWKHFKKFNRTK
jgi:hypothetical protein